MTLIGRLLVLAAWILVALYFVVAIAHADPLVGDGAQSPATATITLIGPGAELPYPVPRKMDWLFGRAI